MNNIVLFLLKSIVVSGILTTWYWLGLRNKQLHQYNRFFLLFTLYASIQVPLLHFQWFTIHAYPEAAYSPVSALLHMVSDSGATGADDTIHASYAGINWETTAFAIAAMISAALLSVLIMRVAWIVRMSRKYKRSQVEGAMFIHTDLPSAPFSFLTWLFWRDTILLESENGRMIFEHELTHIRQKHTYDKLACQALTCICWFNPFYWLIQKELGTIHEFIADEKAIQGHDTNAFARMLLQTHNEGRYLTTGHQIFSSPIKRRLIMLQTTKKPSHAMFRRMMVLPLAAGAILIFSFSPLKEKKNIVKANKKIVLVLDPGHGGADVGVQYGTIKEKDVNLIIANRIKELSPEYNIEAHLTRSKDETLSLQERVAISNGLRADDFISIHVTDDAGRDMADRKFDIAICVETPKLELSRKLGYAVYQRMNEQEGNQTDAATANQGRGLNTKGLYVLRHNAAPCVLIEFANIKNKEQMQMLTDETKLDALCNAVLKGVVEAHRE